MQLDGGGGRGDAGGGERKGRGVKGNAGTGGGSGSIISEDDGNKCTY